MTVNQRLKIFVERRGWSRYRVAKQTGIQEGTLQNLWADRNGMSAETLAKLAAAYPDLDLRWLLLGEGPEPSAPANPTPTAKRGRPRKSVPGGEAGSVSADNANLVVKSVQAKILHGKRGLFFVQNQKTKAPNLPAQFAHLP